MFACKCGPLLPFSRSPPPPGTPTPTPPLPPHPQTQPRHPPTPNPNPATHPPTPPTPTPTPTPTHTRLRSIGLCHGHGTHASHGASWQHPGSAADAHRQVQHPAGSGADCKPDGCAGRPHPGEGAVAALVCLARPHCHLSCNCWDIVAVGVPWAGARFPGQPCLVLPCRWPPHSSQTTLLWRPPSWRSTSGRSHGSLDEATFLSEVA